MAKHPGGFYAAAGPLLRRALGGGDHCRPGPHCWRNRIVTVSYRGSHVSVILADWCGCPGNHTIDLYSDAMIKLTTRFQILGNIPVKITW